MAEFQGAKTHTEMIPPFAHWRTDMNMRFVASTWLRQFLTLVATVGIVAGSLNSVAYAQPGGFGGPGFGPGGGFRPDGVFGVVTSDAGIAELKLSDEQRTKAKAISDAWTEELTTLRRAGFAAGSDEAARNKNKADIEAARKVQEDKLKAVVTQEQFQRAEQLSLHAMGTDALARDVVIAELKITDEQKEKLNKIRTDTYPKFGELFGRRLSEDERKKGTQKIIEDRDKLVMAVLTPDQVKAWEAKLGPKPAELVAAVDPAKTEAVKAEAPKADTPRPEAPVQPVAPNGAVVADFTESKDAPTATPGVEKSLVFNFRFAPWDKVLQRFADEAELSLDLTVVPPGTFNYYDKARYTPTEALDILNGYLLQKGYLLVKRDRFLVVLNIDNPIPPNLIPEVAVEDLPKHGKNELLQIVMSLEGFDAAGAVEEIRDMLGPQGKIGTVSKYNRVVITDIGSNLQRIVRLLSENGAIAEANVPGIKIFPLKYITASEADKIIRDLFGLAPRGRAGVVAQTAAAQPTAQQPYTGSRWGGGDPRFGGFGGQGFGGQSFGGRGDFGRGDFGRGGDSGGGRGDFGRGGDRGSQAPQTPQPVLAAPAGAPVKEKVQLAIDIRTNSLLVTASATDLAIIGTAIKTIDVESPDGPRSRSMNIPQLEVYALQNADLQVVINNLNAILPGLQITEDMKARRLSVYAVPDEQAQVRAIVKQLDGEENTGSVVVIPLKKQDPVAVTTSLRSLFSANRVDPPSVEADALGRRLLVRGTPEQVMQIRKLLAEMGEDGNMATLADRSAGGPMRTIPLNGNDPQQMVSMLEKMFGQMEADRPIIKTVIPALTPTVRQKMPQPLVEPETETELEKPPVTSKVQKTSNSGNRAVTTPAKVADAKGEEELEENEEEEDEGDLLKALDDALNSQNENDSNDPAGTKNAAPESKSAPEAASSTNDQTNVPKKPLNVTVFGGKLIISSDDMDALNRAEEMLEMLNKAVGGDGEPHWTVFYLRSADANETATLLGQLFPSGSVSKSDTGSTLLGSVSQSFSSLGSGLMDVTGLNSLSSGSPLRIIAEPRSNALYVSGTDQQLKQIEEMLRVLDSAELPETLKDRVPRPIVVQHTDVMKVKSIVEDVYKEQLEGENPLAAAAGGGSRGGGGGFNPLAMLMGGAGGGKKKGIEMTISADTQTNTLIVSAADPLFRQVEALVKSVDQMAYDAQPTVQVVNLKTGNSAVVQSALQSLLGKVKVSSTGGASAPATGGSGNFTPSFPSFGGGGWFPGGFSPGGFNPGGFTPGGGSTPGGSSRSSFGSFGGPGAGSFGGRGGFDGGRGGRGGRGSN